MPVRVSIVAVTVAGCTSWKDAVTTAVAFGAMCAFAGAACRPPSVWSSRTSRSAVVVRPPVSAPETTNFHWPSVLGWPFHASMCTPGSSASCASVSCAPPGPVSVAVTCEGATSLYENVSVSLTPSPLGEMTSDDGGAA